MDSAWWEAVDEEARERSFSDIAFLQSKVWELEAALEHERAANRQSEVCISSPLTLYSERLCEPEHQR
jgi:hypothetical protein